MGWASPGWLGNRRVTGTTSDSNQFASSRRTRLIARLLDVGPERYAVAVYACYGDESVL
jgi:hypothetical protein